MVPLLLELGAPRLALVLSFLVLQVAVVIAAIHGPRLTSLVDAVFLFSGACLLGASAGLDWT